MASTVRSSVWLFLMVNIRKKRLTTIHVDRKSDLRALVTVLTKWISWVATSICSWKHTNYCEGGKSVLVGKCEHVIRRTTNSLYYITGGTCRRCKSAMTRWQLVCTASVVLFHRHGYWWLCLVTHGISETSAMQRVHAFNERTQLLWCQFTRCHIVLIETLCDCPCGFTHR